MHQMKQIHQRKMKKPHGRALALQTCWLYECVSVSNLVGARTRWVRGERSGRRSGRTGLFVGRSVVVPGGASNVLGIAWSRKAICILLPRKNH